MSTSECAFLAFVLMASAVGLAVVTDPTFNSRDYQLPRVIIVVR